MYKKNKTYVFIISLLFAFPIFCLFLKSFNLETADQQVWDFISKNQVPDLIFNSISLLVSTLVLSTFFAFVSAFLLEFTDIKYKRLWEKTLLLPLVLPLYVLAYVYLVSFEWSSPFMTFLRDLGFVTLGNLKVKSTFMVSFVFSLGLFPYMVIPFKKTLKQLSGELYWSALILKKSKIKVFFSYIFPLLWKPFLIGASLISMEVLADFGAVSIFNYDTFTTAIYTSWSGFFSYAVGARLSLILVLTTFLISSFEDSIKKNELQGYLCLSYYNVPIKLSKLGQFFSLGFFIFLNLCFFIFPIYQLINWSFESLDYISTSQIFGLLQNTMSLALIVAFLACFIAIVLVFNSRYSDKPSLFIRIALLGYGIPGTVIGVSIYIGFVSILGLSSTKAILLLSLIFGLTYRFLVLPYKFIKFESEKIPKEIEISSLILKQKLIKYIKRVWFPLVKPSFKFAFVFTAIEVIKEMPLTLILRPVGYDTLATKIFEFTSEGDWERAAIPSLIIVLTSLSFSFFLQRQEK